MRKMFSVLEIENVDENGGCDKKTHKWFDSMDEAKEFIEKLKQSVPVELIKSGKWIALPVEGTVYEENMS